MKIALKIWPKQIKKLIPEMIFLVILCIIAYYFSETPVITPSNKKVERQSENIIEIKRHSVRKEKIMDRNLFALDGKYDGVVTSLPEKPYTLIAILIGNEKKVIFRDYQGNIFTAKQKSMLMDGYTIEEITNNSVILKRGKSTKELTIFKPQKTT